MTRCGNPGGTAALLVALVVPCTAQAGPRTFDVAYGGRNVVRFTSSARLETIEGRTGALTGTFRLDPARITGAATGRLEVDPASFLTGIAKRDKDARGPQYLHTEKFPKAAFVLKRVEAKRRDLTASEDAVPVTLHGTLELRGVGADVVVRGEARYVPFDKALAPLKKLGVRGDALHFRGAFTLKLSDLGITVPQILAPKIAPEVTIDLDLFAFAE